MAIRTELTVKLDNTPGALARVCQALTDEKVNVVALNLDPLGRLRLVPDNPVHAAGLLRGRGHEVDEGDVLFAALSNRPGGIGSVTRLLSGAGVNVLYAYVTALTEHDVAALVVAVDDAQRAAAAAGM